MQRGRILGLGTPSAFPHELFNVVLAKDFGRLSSRYSDACSANLAPKSSRCSHFVPHDCLVPNDSERNFDSEYWKTSL